MLDHPWILPQPDSFCSPTYCDCNEWDLHRTLVCILRKPKRATSNVLCHSVHGFEPSSSMLRIHLSLRLENCSVQLMVVDHSRSHKTHPRSDRSCSKHEGPASFTERIRHCMTAFYRLTLAKVVEIAFASCKSSVSIESGEIRGKH